MEAAERNQKFNRLFKEGLIQWENKFDEYRINSRWNVYKNIRQKTVTELETEQRE